MVRKNEKVSVHQQQRMRLKVLTLVVLVVMVVAGVFIVHFVVPSPYFAAQDRAIGSNVSVSGSMVPNTIKAVGTKTSRVPFADTQALGLMTQITPIGKLPAPMMLRFKLNRPVKNGEVAFLATSEGPDGPWALLQPIISSDGWDASVQTDHLSWWQPLWFDLKAAASDFKKEVLDGLTGDMTTEAEQPHCDNESQARQDNYLIASSAKSTLYWCFGFEDGARVLKIVNRMRYPLEVSHGGFTVKQFAGPTLDLDQLARLGSGQTTILYPFEEADYTVNLSPGSQALISTAYSGYAQSLYQLEFGVTTFVDVLGLISNGEIAETGFARTAALMNKFLAPAECANALLPEPNAGKLISGCFTPEQIMEVFGWKGLLLAPLMTIGPLVEFFHSELNVLGDQFNDRDKYQILVRRSAAGTVTTYEVSDGVPRDITAGPDGNLWFTATRLTNSGRIGWIGRITLGGQVTEFPLPNQVTNLQPTSITKGPDGNLWFVLYGDTSLFAPGPGSAIPGQIGRITAGGVVKVFPAATATSNPVFLTTGPDGNVWFTDTDGSIGRITPDGQITEFPVPNALPYGGIAAGADGNMWFAASGAIGRITPNGKVTLFPTNFCPNVSTCALVTGPDGNLWFTDGGNGFIGRITLNGSITKFPTNSWPLEITAGPDGNLWFTVDSTQGNPPSAVGRITPGGSITFPIPSTQGYDLGGITVGPDDNLWFAGQTSGRGIIVRITL
jgi:streptogramin lyase